MIDRAWGFLLASGKNISFITHDRSSLLVLTEQRDTSRAMIAIHNIEKINSIELHDIAIRMVSTVTRLMLDK